MTRNGAGKAQKMIFEKNDKIVFIGDSISDYDRARPVGEGLNSAWGHSYVADVGALLGSAYPELNLRVVNMGIGGNQIRHLDARWQSDVLDLKPDWVSVLIGINDVWRQFDTPTIVEDHVPPEEFRATYEKLVERTLPRVKGMILMTPFYIAPNPADAMRARMDEYGAIVKDVARAHDLISVDLQAGWETLLAHVHSTAIAWDRVHPNQVGCMHIARQFLQAVGFDR